MPRRNDATHVDTIRLYNRIFPYLMKRRSDSVVFYSLEIEMTNAVQFIQRKNREAGERKYRIFDLIIAALVRTTALRPSLNRFICNGEFWQRNELSFNFVVKQDLTEEAPEKNAIVRFESDMIFEEVAAIMRQTINSARRNDQDESEALLKFLLRLPKPILKIVISMLGALDKRGRMPRSIGSIDGLHVSAFVSNLGSINIPNAPFHHLYEWGTTSIFITLGKMHRSKHIDENDHEYIKDNMLFGFTIDERIAEGFYFMKAMRLFRELLENPELLELRPNLSKAR